MPKFSLSSAEFYITNVCNLTCVECNRFNNQPFRGHYSFNYDQYTKWAKRIDLGAAHVLGGEPALNPQLCEFLIGIATLWPSSQRRIVTNGTSISAHKQLHHICAKHQWSLEVSVHNINHLPLIADEIHKTFGELVNKRSVTPYPNIQKYISKTFGPYINTDYEEIPGTLVTLTTSLGVEIHLVAGWTFHKNAIKNKHTLEVFDSDPVKAHGLCTMSSAHFIGGHLYKCGVVKTLPDMLQQQGIPVDPLMLAYKPLNHNFTYEEWMQLTQHAIPQCKFCSDDPQDWQATLPTDSHIKGKIIPIKNAS